MPNVDEPATAGKNITLSDGVTVMSSEREYHSIMALDKKLIAKVWSPAKAKQVESRFNARTFGELRAAWQALSPEDQIRTPQSLRLLIERRLSSRILCGCGSLIMLTKHSWLCQEPGCEVFRHRPDLHEMREAFPDRRHERS